MSEVPLYSRRSMRASAPCLLQGGESCISTKREFFIDNLLVRIHFIIVMIGWTGLAPGMRASAHCLLHGGESCITTNTTGVPR